MSLLKNCDDCEELPKKICAIRIFFRAVLDNQRLKLFASFQPYYPAPLIKARKFVKNLICAMISRPVAQQQLHTRWLLLSAPGKMTGSSARQSNSKERR
jgi:hypothetical protein